MSLTISLTNPDFAPTLSQISLPVVNINTSGVAINSITTSVSGTISVASADGTKSYLSSAAASFHVHGNSTAVQPKVPYTVKLNSSVDLLASMGFACPYLTSASKPVCDKSKSYILLANYNDKTLLRDWSASALANAIPYGGSYLDETALPSGATGTIPSPSGTSANVPWAPHSAFVELYLNGAYQGTYQLIEKVNVDSHRVNVAELAETQTSGDLSGGYLLEIDQRQAEAYNFVTPQGVDVGIVDPDFSPDPEITAQTTYINNYINSAETALYSSNFTDPAAGWRGYFDEASTINYYLINELMGNSDAGRFFSSIYMYKAADDPFLYMGPVWDFDVSSGNAVATFITDPTVEYMSIHAPWYARLFQDPTFKAHVVAQFNTLKSNGVFTQWLNAIRTQSTALAQAQSNNFNRWPILGEYVWPNAVAKGTYSGEVDFLEDWLTLRLGYYDSLYNSKAGTYTTVTASRPTATAGTPVTITAVVHGGSSPTGYVYFLSQSILVGKAAVDSSRTAILTTTSLSLGQSDIYAVYAGDAVNAFGGCYPPATVVTTAAPQASVTGISSSTATTVSGSQVTFSVAVVGTSGSSTPSGTVTLVSNGNVLGTATLSGGVATYSTSALPWGTDSVDAVYGGDSNYLGSTSVSILVAVQPISVTFGTSPAGFAYSVDGSTYTGQQTLPMDAGSSHTVGTVPQTLNDTVYNFSAWSDGGAATHTVTVPSSAAGYSVTYAPGDSLAALTVSGLPATVLPGTPYTVTVTAGGSGGGSMASYTGTVSFTATDPLASFTPATYTFQPADQGVHAFTVSFGTGGSRTVTASSATLNAAQTTTVGDYIWLGNRTGTIVKMTEAGALVSSANSANGSSSAYHGLAVDGVGTMYSVAPAANAVQVATRGGVAQTPLSGGGLNAPVSVAVDGAGSIWVANSGNASVSAFTSAGTALSGVNGLARSAATTPSAIAVDSSGGVWVTSRTHNSVTHIIGTGTPVTTPQAAAVAGVTIGVKP